MVGIAQLVERLVVVQEVAGSSPVTHPKQRPVAVQRPQPGRGFKPRYSPQYSRWSSSEPLGERIEATYYGLDTLVPRYSTTAT
jgi:hypothetical protein